MWAGGVRSALWTISARSCSYSVRITPYDVPPHVPCTIPEFPSTGSPEEFYEQHVLPSVPAIIRGLPDIQEWPAYQWKSFQTIGEGIPEDVKVLVEHGIYVEKDFEASNVYIHEYLKQLDDNPIESSGYIAQCPIFHQIPGLAKQVNPPSVSSILLRAGSSCPDN